MPSPKGSSDTNLLNLTALSASDIWAVGDYKNAAGDYATLSEHWNGTKWTQIATPLPSGDTDGAFAGLATVSGTSFWGADGGDTVTEHWNGTKWSMVASPNPAGGRWPSRRALFQCVLVRPGLIRRRSPRCRPRRSWCCNRRRGSPSR